MSDAKERHGQCLCGAVKVTVSNGAHSVGACHCAMCRRWGGGPFMEINGGTEVSYEGEDSIAIFASSPWAERGFCQTCGTNLFYRIRETGETMVSVGLFEASDDLVFERQVFVDERPEFYRFENKTEDLTGAEIFALFGPSD